jgi:hypothetical protein
MTVHEASPARRIPPHRLSGQWGWSGKTTPCSTAEEFDEEWGNPTM